MKTTKYFLISLILLLQTEAYAHGEDKPGPHKGYIRMPGAFHTEVVPEKKGYRIYLLDLNWQNPSVTDSDVKAVVIHGRKKTDLECVKEKDSFFCQNNIKQKGELQIQAQREGQKGAAAVYPLPLKFEIPKLTHDQHH